MIVSISNLGGEATRAAAEGQGALAVGDLVRAQDRFKEAGEILERKIVGLRKQPEKHLTRFLAASQYYHGGHYQQALTLAQRIETKFLPAAVQPLFRKFLQDAKERASTNYQAEIRKQLMSHFTRKDYRAMIEVLQEHPYILPAGGAAFIRANCCEHLGDYEAAAAFYADAIKWSPEESELVCLTSAHPLLLSGRGGRLDEAWRYVAYQLHLIPHPITRFTASVLRFNQATQARDEVERRRLFHEQLKYFQEGWEGFQKLSDRMQRNQMIREYVAFCFEIAAWSLHLQKEDGPALEMCARGLAFAPAFTGTWTIRGMLTYPHEQARADFRQAVKLGEKDYTPCYFLAHSGMLAGDYAEVDKWARLALDRKPSPRVAAQLYNWLAIAQSKLGAGREELLALFRRARELDPDSAAIRQNVALIDSSGPKSMLDLGSEMEQDEGIIAAGSEVGREYMSKHEQFSNSMISETMIDRTLAAVG
jgi:tetratricopeptide (TPR) repeat protein